MTLDGPGGDLAQRFRRFAERECAGISPLYAALARQVADNAFLLGLASRTGPGQPPPNMLFAAVHFLLLHDKAVHPLAAFYASMTSEPEPPDEAFPAFQDFCHARAPDIVGLLCHRVVNTNEVRRTACLLPAFATVALESPTPLHLVEVGASAGLNLLWDCYAYDYGAAGRLGPENAQLRLSCDVRGDHRPPIPSLLPEIGRRLGIDTVPQDPADPEDAAWLRALVWPEQRARAERLSAALRLAARVRPKVIRGDGTTALPNAAASMPADGTLCVFHSFTLNQFSAEACGRFLETLRTLARARPLFQIGLEWGEVPVPELVVSRHDATGTLGKRLALCDAHGAWIEWLHPSHAESGIDRGRTEP